MQLQLGSPKPLVEEEPHAEQAGYKIQLYVLRGYVRSDHGGYQLTPIASGLDKGKLLEYWKRFATKYRKLVTPTGKYEIDLIPFLE